MPIILAGSLGSGLAKLTHFFEPKPAFPTFLAARPMTSAAIVANQLRMSALSVLLTWAVVALLTGIWMVLSGNVSASAQQWSALTGHLAGHPVLWLFLCARRSCS